MTIEKYGGLTHTKEVWTGPKSATYRVTDTEAINLVAGIMNLLKLGRKEIDLSYKVKDGTITVTSPIPGKEKP